MLGAQIGVIGNAISNWENGKARPDIALLPKICDALDITLYDLLGMPAPQKLPVELEALYKLHAEEIQQLLTKYYRLSPGHQFSVMALMDNLDEAENSEICKHIIEKTEFSKALAAGFDPGEEFDDKGEKLYLYKTNVKEPLSNPTQ